MKKVSPCAAVLYVIVLAMLAAWAQAADQAGAALGIETYAGLTVTGTVGAVYSIEGAADLSRTNSADAWRCLEFLQLPTSPYVWIDRSEPATARRVYRAVEWTAPTSLVFVPPGTFRMGSPSNEVGRAVSEGPQMDVTIRRGFWIGAYEVTQAEYLAVTGNNPSYFNADRTSQGSTDFGIDLTRPVEQVNWFEATNYCALLTERERAAGTIRPASVYRLPTEAEWEYACRAWTSTRFSYGDDPGYTNLSQYVWLSADIIPRTHSVGQRLPNNWGLYDMLGNAFEWCQDWFGTYPGGLQVDPQGPASGTVRAIRGGSLSGVGRQHRSASRGNAAPSMTYPDLGFRVILAPGQANF